MSAVSCAVAVAVAFQLASRFELTTAELKALDALDTGVRGGPEPDDITLEAYGRPIPEA